MLVRDIRIGFKLTEEKKALLQEYAESYGISMSALCALIVGQWLYQQEKVAKPVIESVSEVVTDIIRKEVEKEEGLDALLRKALEARKNGR